MIGTSIIVLFLTWMLKEPSVKAEKAERLTMKKIIWAVKEELQRNPSLFIWMILSQIIGTLMCMFYFYYQNQLPDLKDWQISVVMLIGSALNILAVYLASMIGKKYSALKLFPSVVLLTGASYLLSYFGTPFIYILIYLISNALYALSSQFLTMIYKSSCQVKCGRPCSVLFYDVQPEYDCHFSSDRLVD